MLGSTNAAATIAVKDIAVARKFYEDKLGLELSGTEGEVCAATGADRPRFWFTSRASPAPTRPPPPPGSWAMRWTASCGPSRPRGWRSSTMTCPDTTRQGDVHVSGKTRVAWFKDPDGNILSIVNG